MTVGIAEIAGIAAVIGLVRGLQQQRAAGDCEIKYRIDLLDRAAIPGERRSAKPLRPRMVWQRDVGSEFPTETARAPCRRSRRTRRLRRLRASPGWNAAMARDLRSRCARHAMGLAARKPGARDVRHRAAGDPQFRLVCPRCRGSTDNLPAAGRSAGARLQELAPPSRRRCSAVSWPGCSISTTSWAVQALPY